MERHLILNRKQKNLILFNEDVDSLKSMDCGNVKAYH